MGLSLTPLLIHSEDVPPRARRALLMAQDGPPEQRQAHLELAARVLVRETGIDCRDAQDLLGMPLRRC